MDLFFYRDPEEAKKQEEEESQPPQQEYNAVLPSSDQWGAQDSFMPEPSVVPAVGGVDWNQSAPIGGQCSNQNY